MTFPREFTWGVAASSYQIEGAVGEDGRGPSIWDTFVRKPGTTFEGQTGDVACDHYHRWREDVALMKELGVGAYRLSIAWPRVLPLGTGAVNAKGIEFYDRLIDALLAAGISPWVTLYHWDMPQALQDRGGFANRDFVPWFADYAALAAGKLGDRVGHWMTFNEPPCSIGLGLQVGTHAPGYKLAFGEVLRAGHHLLLAHGRAVQAIRAGCRRPVKVSLALTGRERVPATESPADVEAARRDYFACGERGMWNLSWWGDAVYLGRYPADGLEAYGADAPAFTHEEMKLISEPLDFMGYNCYSGFPVRARPDGSPEAVPEGWGPGCPRGTLPWLAIAPAAAYWAARFQAERYGRPLVFTENGFCNTDFVQLDGKVHDPQRIDFLARYLSAIARARAEGIPVEGYFHWSILDNFEWSEGYKDRFGLVHVDYRTGKRTPKDSFHWYRDAIRGRGAALPAFPPTPSPT